MRAHTVPALVEKIGTILDLTVVDGDKRLRVDEWQGWQLLVPPDAFERRAGQGRLYCVRGELGAELEDAAEIIARAGAAYRAWHKRDARDVRALKVADAVGTLLGRVERIGYRSDKWGRRGKTHDYDHDFRERGGRPPKLWIDAAHVARATTAIVTGGDFVVRHEGIS